MALTSTQQSEYDRLNSEVTNITAAYNAAVQAVANATNRTNTCKAARDAVSWGWQKENACSQNTFSSLIAAQTAAENDRNAKSTALNNAKKALADFVASVDTQNVQGAQALAGDASFNVQSQQITSQILQAQVQAQLEADKSAKHQKTIIIIGLSVLGAGLIAGFIIWFVKRSKKLN